jgi:abortive infection bacteriophage resistance protein
MASIPYNKPYLTLNQQVDLLRSRGMALEDTPKARHYLQRLGYYRLSGYWYPFRESRISGSDLQVTVLDSFRAGVEFRHAVDLYVFDKKLRLLFMDAMERIEIALRVEISSVLGTHDPFAHRNPALLHGNFTKKTDPKTGTTPHAEWLRRFDDLSARSKEEFFVHFKQKYNSPLPIWIATELWDYGLLSRFLSGMRHTDLIVIASRYGIPRPELLTSWIRSVNHVRNICAHHSRLWNRPPSDQPKIPHAGEIPDLNHLVTDPYARSRIYAVAAVMQFILKTINPSSQWSRRVKDHFVTFPAAPGIDARQTGFPQGWEDLPLWS